MNHRIWSGTFGKARRTAAAIALIGAAALGGGAAAEEKIILRTSFEEGKGDAPAGWTGQGSAIWPAFARTGRRSIEIRSWKKDAEITKVWEDYQAQVKKLEAEGKKPEKGPENKADTKGTFWLSDPIQLSGAPVKVSFWGANNITYMNDESFHAEIGLVPCKADGSYARDPAARAAIGGALSGKPLHFYREQRENYMLYSRAVPEGLCWEYKDLVMKPAKGAYRVALQFQKEPDGQVWVDDLVVSESPDYKSEDDLAAAAATPAETLPWKMEINFPVSFNLFLKGDPLEMDVALIAAQDLPRIKDGMTLVYEIRDYDYRWIHADTLKLKAGAEIAWKAPKYLAEGVVTNLYVAYQGMANVARGMDGRTVILPVGPLPELLNRYDGQLLFVKADLFDGKKKLASDEVTFGITVPAERKKENLWRGGKVVNRWGPAGADLESDFLKPALQRGNLYNKLGCQWNSGGLEPAWPKEKGGAVPPPAKPVTPLPDYGYLSEYYSMQSGIRALVIPWGPYNGFPKWCMKDDAETLARYGYKWIPDIEAHAQAIAAGVKRLEEQYPNAVAISPTAGEGPQNQYRFELQQAAYKAIKAVTTNVPVGVWHWGTEVKELQAYKDCWDFLDNEFYADPRFVGKEPPQVAAAEGLRRKQKLFAVVNEGCALSGSEQQPEQTKGVFDFHLFQWKYGVKLTGQFEFGGAYRKKTGEPLLRDALSAVFGGTGHTGGAQRFKLTRYDMQNGTNCRAYFFVGVKYPLYLQAQYQPALPVMALCNVLRFLDSAVFEQELPLEDVFALRFERLGKTVLFLETQPSKLMDDTTVELSGIGGCPLETLDSYGRRHRLTPAGDTLLVTVGHQLIALIFDKILGEKALKAKIVDDVVIRMKRAIVKRSAGELDVQMGANRVGTLVMDLDARLEAPAKVALKNGQASIAVKPLEERPSGMYREYIRLMQDDKALGLLGANLVFKSSGIDATLEGSPMTKSLDPALRVQIVNSTDKETTLKARFQDRYTVATDRPEVTEKSVTVGANSATNVEFGLNRERVKLNQDYPAAVTLALPDGTERDMRDKVSYRGAPRRVKPIALDGDLSDWPLADLLPLEPDWLISVWGRGGGAARNFCGTWAQQTCPESRFKAYFLWDEEGLYFAATFNDTDPEQVEKVYWNTDCMFLDMYAGKYTAGEGTTMRPCVMHLMVLKDGTPGLYDKNGKVWPADKWDELGVKFGAKRTKEGFVYEYFMSRKYLNNLKLEPGVGFSASMVGYRKDYTVLQGPGGEKRPMFAFYRNCFDFDGDVNDMARFVLTDK